MFASDGVHLMIASDGGLESEYINIVTLTLLTVKNLQFPHCKLQSGMTPGKVLAAFILQQGRWCLWGVAAATCFNKRLPPSHVDS
mmetsp:Transcript_30208/g.78468  ORF Transcript_30208/g.78468 Transcript_30208/m.78468 type:complete len:85 (+) Transcript_30208:1022-1276(+)